ncbi:MAG: glutamine synthetase family protein [Paracoccaceae bacterium]
MPGNMTLGDLNSAAASGEIDTVIACQVDMQGRLAGKRFHVSNFLDSAHQETHSCNYLLATDFEMETVPGYRASSWEAGYGDYTMKPDLATLRRIPWLEGTALVICDVQDHHTHADVPHSPRAVLKRQLARLDDLGMSAMMATELEFFLYRETYDEALAKGYRDLHTVGPFNADYSIHLTSREENVMRAIRNGLYGAGIEVECSKGEAFAGQEEINIRYSDALMTADTHAIVKNACKEIAWQNGNSITFMAKPGTDIAGSSSHIHQSLWSADGKTPLFFDKSAEHGMSDTMRHYVAGLLEHAQEITFFLAPNVNSYKRFTKGLFAPTKAIWSPDNRTAGFRLCGEGTKAVRIECRIGGSDLNPYLALAAQIAAGIDGIERKLELEPAFVGDAYEAAKVRDVPATLREAAELLTNSKMLRSAFGDEVIDHYHHAAMWEQSEYDRVVTDWEIHRGFDRG